MPPSWQQRLATASCEREVVDVARDFLAQFSPYEIVTLPMQCRPPGKIVDSHDITTYAFSLVRHRCDGGEGVAYAVHKLADFFAHAAVRLSQILHSNTRRENPDEDRRSA